MAVGTGTDTGTPRCRFYVQNTTLLPGQANVTQAQYEAISFAQLHELWTQFGELSEVNALPVEGLARGARMHTHLIGWLLCLSPLLPPTDRFCSCCCYRVRCRSGWMGGTSPPCRPPFPA